MLQNFKMSALPCEPKGVKCCKKDEGEMRWYDKIRRTVCGCQIIEGGTHDPHKGEWCAISNSAALGQSLAY